MVVDLGVWAAEVLKYVQLKLFIFKNKLIECGGLEFFTRGSDGADAPFIFARLFVRVAHKL